MPTFSKRQNQIIDAAINLAAAEGIQALTMKNLAAAVAVSEPALYRHFANKAEILRALISRFDNGVEALEQTEQSGFAGIEAFMLSRIQQAAANPPLARIMFAEELFWHDGESADGMRQMMHRHRNFILEHLEQGIAVGELRSDVEPEMMFRMLMGPLRLLIKQWAMSQYRFDLTEKGRELINTLKILLRSNEGGVK